MPLKYIPYLCGLSNEFSNWLQLEKIVHTVCTSKAFHLVKNVLKKYLRTKLYIDSITTFQFSKFSIAIVITKHWF